MLVRWNTCETLASSSIRLVSPPAGWATLYLSIHRYVGRTRLVLRQLLHRALIRSETVQFFHRRSAPRRADSPLRVRPCSTSLHSIHLAPVSLSRPVMHDLHLVSHETSLPHPREAKNLSRTLSLRQVPPWATQKTGLRSLDSVGLLSHRGINVSPGRSPALTVRRRCHPLSPSLRFLGEFSIRLSPSSPIRLMNY